MKFYKYGNAKKICGNAPRKGGNPQLNEVLKNTETPQKICGNTSKKRGNTLTKSSF